MKQLSQRSINSPRRIHSVEIEARVLELRDVKVPRKEIAKQLNVRFSYVKTILGKHNHTLPMEDRQKNAYEAKLKKDPDAMNKMRSTLTREVVEKRNESIRQAYINKSDSANSKNININNDLLLLQNKEKGIVKITGYLTQAKLEEALRKIVELDNWKGSEIKLTGYNYRWDMSYIDKQGVQFLVEFDGDRHYKDSLTISSDNIKDNLAALNGLKIIRIPYWVQLTNETLKYYFNMEASIEQDFPHGFITTKSFPASFCELGIQRFKKELEQLPLVVRNEIIDSLKERIKEYGQEYVVPSCLNI